MPDVKKSNGFDINKSLTAKYLDNLTDKSLFYRYFKKGSTTSNFGDLMIEELNQWADTNQTVRKYPLLASINGKCLDIVVNALELKMPNAFFPNGFIPNIEAITKDIEKVLSENIKAVHEAMVASQKNDKGTLFIFELTDFFNELVSNRAVGYSLDNSNAL